MIILVDMVADLVSLSLRYRAFIAYVQGNSALMLLACICVDTAVTGKLMATNEGDITQTLAMRH